MRPEAINSWSFWLPRKAVPLGPQSKCPLLPRKRTVAEKVSNGMGWRWDGLGLPWVPREAEEGRVIPFQGMVVQSSQCWMFWYGKEVLRPEFLSIKRSQKREDWLPSQAFGAWGLLPRVCMGCKGKEVGGHL